MSMETCPLGGLWYTCTAQTPSFLGCCTSDPCNGSGCPSSDLRAAGMGTGSGPDGLSSNDASYWPNVQCSVGQWWTCAMQTPSFQGCCESNPCGGSGTGCPSGMLYPAAFKSVTAAASSTKKQSSNPQITLAVASTGSVSTLSSASSVSSPLPATTTSSPSSPTTTPQQTTTPNPSSNTRAIAGGAAGGSALIVLLLLANRRRHSHPQVLSSNLLAYTKASRNSPSAVQVSSANRSQVQANTYAIYNTIVNLTETHYPGRPIFGIPNTTTTTYTKGSASSAPTSPGPPPYQSPPSPSSNPRSNTHELATSGTPPIHGVEISDALGIQQFDGGTLHEAMANDAALGFVPTAARRANGRDRVVELPDNPSAGDDRRRARTSVGMGRVRRSDQRGSDGAVSHTSGNGRRGNRRESYTSWQTLSL